MEEAQAYKKALEFIIDDTEAAETVNFEKDEYRLRFLEAQLAKVKIVAFNAISRFLPKPDEENAG